MAGDAKGIRAGRAYIELGVVNKMDAGFRAAQAHLRAFGAVATKAGLALAGVGAAASAGLLAASKVFAEVGDNLDEMAARTGVSVEALSELQLAVEESGASMDDFETGLRKMQRSIGDAASGSSAAAEALARLGLSAAALISLSPEEQLARVADALSSIENPAQRTAAAMAVFGKSGTKLIPLLSGGAAGLAKFRSEAQALGLSITGDMAKSAAKTADAFDHFNRVLKQTWIEIGAAVAPAVQTIFGGLMKAVVGINKFVRDNQKLVVAAGAATVAIGAAGAALVALGGAAYVLAGAFGGVLAVGGAITGVFAAMVSPIGLATTAILAVGTAMVTLGGIGEGLGGVFRDVFGRVGNSIVEVTKAIVGALAVGNFKDALALLRQAFSATADAIGAAFSQAWKVMWTQLMRGATIALGFLRGIWIDLSSDFKSIWETTIHSVMQFLKSLGSIFKDTWAFAKRLAGIKTIEDVNKEAASGEAGQSADRTWSQFFAESLDYYKTGLVGLQKISEKLVGYATTGEWPITQEEMGPPGWLFDETALKQVTQETAAAPSPVVKTPEELAAEEHKARLDAIEAERKAREDALTNELGAALAQLNAQQTGLLAGFGSILGQLTDRLGAVTAAAKSLGQSTAATAMAAKRQAEIRDHAPGEFDPLNRIIADFRDGAGALLAESLSAQTAFATAGMRATLAGGIAGIASKNNDPTLDEQQKQTQELKEIRRKISSAPAFE